MPSYLITGASRGLGYQWLKTLCADPSNLVIGLVRNVPATSSRLAADKITNVHLLSADVTDTAALSAAATAAASLLSDKKNDNNTSGGLDILIHNAAWQSEISSSTTLLDHAPAELESELVDAFRSNAVAVAHVINAFLPLVRKGKEKKVISVSTGLADLDATTKGLAFAVPYSVSKAAGNMIVAKYHATLGRPEGILFLSLSPGLVDTIEGEGGKEAMESLKGYFLETFGRDYAPEWEGAISPEVSVRMQLDVIRRADVEGFGGGFVSHHGNKKWL